MPDPERPVLRGPLALNPPAASKYAQIWVNGDLHPIGQATAVGPVFVGLITQEGRLYMTGIDPATGRQLWKQGMTVPSTVTQGEAVHVVKIGDDKVAFTVPDSHSNDYRRLDYSQFVVVDARTGAELASSPLARFTSWPYPCANGKDACVLSHGNRAGREHQYRLDVARNDYIEDSEGLPPNTRVLEGGRLLDLADRPGNTLAWLSKGKIQWRTSASAAFPPGFSSDQGWVWHLYADQHVVVGSIYGESPRTDDAFVRDLASTAATTGLAEATGEVLWRDAGTSFGCIDGGHEPPVRCRRRGRAITSADGITSYDQLDITVEGFDPATGKTTWSFSVGPAKELVDAEAARIIAGPSRLVLNSPAGIVVLDHATGSATPPAPGDAFWCLVHKRYFASPPYYSSSGRLRYDRPGGELATICDASGHPSPALPSAEATIAAGARVGNYAIIAQPGGYLGFRLPAP